MMNDESKTTDNQRVDPSGSAFINHHSSIIIHTIRLRGAWAVAPDGTRSRKFGWPTALDPHERVWLVCDALPSPAAVSVNGVAVTPEADITPLLAPRNDLVIRIPAGAELGPVALEVRPADTSRPAIAEN